MLQNYLSCVLFRGQDVGTSDDHLYRSCTHVKYHLRRCREKYLCICLNYILLAGGAVQIYLNKSRATVPGSAFIRPSLFFCLESWRSTTDDCQFFQAQNWRTVPRAELAVGLRFNFACSGGGGRGRGGWININVFRTFTVAFFGRSAGACIGRAGEQKEGLLQCFTATTVCFQKLSNS